MQHPLILPGDYVSLETNSIIGQGLFMDGNKVISNATGILNSNRKSKHWIDIDTKRYIPHKGDQVVGIIEEKTADFYIVNIYSGSHCILSRLAFEGATKRSKPELKKGDIIYARVIIASDPSLEQRGQYETRDTELSCLTTSGPKKEWTTGETIYGELPNGIVIRVSILAAKKLLRHDCVILNALGSNYTFEVAVGMNGVVWIRSNNAVETIIIRNAIINSQYLKSDAHIIAMVEELISLSKKMK